MMPQFDFVLINSIFFICFFYFIFFFSFIYNKLPILSFFIKYLEKMLYSSYIKIIEIENYIFSFPYSLFHYLGMIEMFNKLTISFFKNKKLLILEFNFDFQLLF